MHPRSQACEVSELLDDLPKADRGERFATARKENTFIVDSWFNQVRPFVLHIAGQSIATALRERDDAPFAAFADYSQRPVTEVQVFQPCIGELVDSNAARAEELHHRLIAER